MRTVRTSVTDESLIVFVLSPEPCVSPAADAAKCLFYHLQAGGDGVLALPTDGIPIAGIFQPLLLSAVSAFANPFVFIIHCVSFSKDNIPPAPLESVN